MDFFTTNHKVAAWIVRVTGVLLSFALVVTGLAMFPETYFLFLTNWGSLLTAATFSLILLGLRWKPMSLAARYSLPAVWMLNASITVTFWCIVFPQVPDVPLLLSILFHGPYLILTTVELLWLDSIPVRWLDIVASLVIQVVYVLCVNLPITLVYGELYPGIDYVSALSYITIGVMVTTTILTGVIGICIRRRTSITSVDKT